ncbi:MAG TPA: cyclase [Chloroflexi bacterium]|nr:cyclase [Chloroflexota bacterium]
MPPVIESSSRRPAGKNRTASRRRQSERGSISAASARGGHPVRIVDLSHPLEPDMSMFPGLPAPSVTAFLSREASAAHYAGGTAFLISRIDLVGNTGTYLDTPFHRYADGVDATAIPLERFVHLPAVVIAAVQRDGRPAVDEAQLAGVEMMGRSVLVASGWDRRWKTPAYGEPGPYLTAAAAERLRTAGATLVGIDGMNVDDMADRSRPVHSTLLRAGIPILENLCNLDQLPASGFYLHAAPVAVKGTGSFPVRAYALIP